MRIRPAHSRTALPMFTDGHLPALADPPPDPPEEQPTDIEPRRALRLRQVTPDTHSAPQKKHTDFPVPVCSLAALAPRVILCSAPPSSLCVHIGGPPHQDDWPRPPPSSPTSDSRRQHSVTRDDA